MSVTTTFASDNNGEFSWDISFDISIFPDRLLQNDTRMMEEWMQKSATGNLGGDLEQN